MHIKVNGTPAAQGSKTRTPSGGMRESSRNLPAWREAVRAETQREVERWHGGKTAFTSGVEIQIVLTLRRPQSHWRIRGGVPVDELRPDVPDYPYGKPDYDKLARAIGDALVDGGAVADDSLIITASVTKDYAEFGQPAGCEVWIDPLRKSRARFTVSDPAREAIADAKARGLIGR